MTVLDILALIVLALIISIVIWLVVLFGSLPGNIAKKRNHPQTEAINALGWIGIITLGASWLVAIVWAYYIPAENDQDNSELERRIAALEQQLQQTRPAAENNS